MKTNLISVSQLEQIRTSLELPTLWLQISDEWSSSKTNHRGDLRAALAAFSEESLHTRSLTTYHLSFSISHCPQVGGFAVTKFPYQIGLDIEVTDRVKPEVIARVSSEQELIQAPSPTVLWTAKEAAFKSLMGERQPATVSAVTIQHWKGAGDLFWLWSARNNKSPATQIRGCAFQQGQVSISLGWILADTHG